MAHHPAWEALRAVRQQWSFLTDGNQHFNMSPNAHPPQICLKVLAAIGPLSWLLLGVYLLMTMEKMWVGLAALYYGLPVIFGIHILAPVGLLWRLRHCRHRASHRWVYWSFTYYGLMPVIIVGLLVWLQGVSGALESITSILREIRFQINHAGWGL